MYDGPRAFGLGLTVSGSGSEKILSGSVPLYMMVSSIVVSSYVLVDHLNIEKYAFALYIVKNTSQKH